MPLNLQAIAELSRVVVGEQRSDLEVVAVTAPDGGVARTEVLVTVEGCHSGPCQLLINVSRADHKTFLREFAQKLRDELKKHAHD